MHLFFGRRPSPSLLISILALFVALGGTAWAAHKIGSKEIKAGAVNGAKIKNGAVTGAKIAPNSVTGKQINESSLGTVPSAEKANSAETATLAQSATSARTADSAQSAATALNFARYASSPIVRAGLGQEVTIMQRGPFSFVGHCVNGGGGSAEAFVTATTSQAGSTFSNAVEAHSEADFDPGEENAVGAPVASVGPATNDTEGVQGTNFRALSADGAVRLSGEATAAVNYFGSTCAFWGWTIDAG
ncbi:MAG TPA: hypothetical protein VNN15_01750 [Solirubrobacterales bacterium]|nr:hypothetical protein [Solirubrobacterales bacterium]